MWHVEKDPILRSTIVAVAIFDRPPDFERLRRAHRTRDLSHPALSPTCRCRRRSGSGRRVGRSRQTFDLDFHLRRMRLPAPGTERTLLNVLQPIATAGFDRARPLWEFTLIEGSIDDDGTERAAFAMKVHHAVTDGVGGMALLAQLVDLTADADEPTGDAPAAPAPESMDAVALDARLGRATRRAGCSASCAASPRTAMRAAGRDCRDPIGTRRATSCARPARSAACVAPATEPMSPVMRDRGLGRRLDCSTSRSTTSAARRRRPKAASTTCSSPRSWAGCIATTSATATARCRCA